ncbi:MAG TPA: carbohydrate ABC transporter permease [Chloroflexia bacterium]|nr:carbohydrate ABC transporter permease [Chloroflexia bacterium]
MVGSKKAPWMKIFRLPLYLLALTMVLPYYWMLIGAFKSVPELRKVPPTFIVQNPTFNNFYDPVGNKPPDHTLGLFQRLTDAPWGFGSFFVNSLIVTTVITILSLLIASAAAYALAKLRIPGRNILFLLIVASMMVPWQVLFIPNFLTIKNLGWINSFQALIIPALPKAFAVFFLRQFMTSLPDEMLEAARIDGASEFRIWWQIVMPLIRPALTAMSIFTILGEWNNFVWPLVVIQDSAHATIPLALSRLNQAFFGSSTLGVLMAGSLLASIPTVIMFLAFQKQFVEGIALSSVKG